VAELNAPGAFRGRIIKAENIGQSSDDLARRTACGEPVLSLSKGLPNQTLTFDSLCGTIVL